MNEAIQFCKGSLSVVTTQIPKLLSPSDVSIRVCFSGVCGTDLHILSGDFPGPEKAVILGHEFSGVIHEIGEQVHHVKVGDRVVVDPQSHCHVCAYCFNGQPHFCKTGGIRSTTGIWKDGGWCRFCVVSSALVQKIPDNVDLDTAVFAEPFSCIVRGWSLLGIIKTDAKILICGAGIIGLLWSALLHFKGLRNVTISEISEHRRTLAKNINLGFKVVHPDMLAEQHEGYQWYSEDATLGFDIIIDCSGAPEAIQQAFQWLRRGAKFQIFGCAPQSSKIEISPFEINFRELHIFGSHLNPHCFPEAIAMVQEMAAYLKYEKLGVRTYQLHDYPSALSALKEGIISKAVFKLDQ